MALNSTHRYDHWAEALKETLADPNAGRCSRIMAALTLSWRQRVDSGQPIDVPCLDLADGVAQFMVLPAESFVAYQLIAQRFRPHSFVVVAGYGEGGAGCVPSDRSWKEGYDSNYCWVPPMAENLVTRAMIRAMGAKIPE